MESIRTFFRKERDVFYKWSREDKLTSTATALIAAQKKAQEEKEMAVKLNLYNTHTL